MKNLKLLELGPAMNTWMVIALLLIQVGASHAQSNKQEKTVTGFLVTKEKSPISGASVMVKGTTRTAMTDFGGNFSIKASEGDVLVVSFAGFSNEEVTIGEKNTLTIYLDAESWKQVYWCCTSHSEVPHCAPNKSELEPTHSKDEVYAIKGP